MQRFKSYILDEDKPLSKGPWDKNPKSIESGQGSWKPLRNASADERAAIAKRKGRPSPAVKKAFKETMRKKFGSDWGRGEVGESFGDGPVPPVQRRTGSTRAEVRAGKGSEPLGTKRDSARVDYVKEVSDRTLDSAEAKARQRGQTKRADKFGYAADKKRDKYHLARQRARTPEQEDDAERHLESTDLFLKALTNVLLSIDEHIIEAFRRPRRAGETSKHEVGTMGTRPATESPRGEMAKEYSRRKGTPVERYNAAKKSITNLSTQRETGRSPKVMKKTKKAQDAIMADIKSYKGKNWAGD